MSPQPATSGAFVPSAQSKGKRKPREGRPAPLPRPMLTTAAVVVAGAGLGATTALAITAETASQFAAPGGAASFAGSLTGLAGTYLALVMVLLVSRIPFVERVLGLDGLLRWHRRLAPAAGAMADQPPGGARAAAHRRLRTGGQDGSLARGWHAAHPVPRHHHRHSRACPDVPGRCHLHPGGAAAAAPGDLVVGAPVHVPGAGHFVRPCHRARPVLRRSSAD